MRRVALALWVGVSGGGICGCEAVPGGVLVPGTIINSSGNTVPGRVLLGFPTLDGRWVLSGADGRRSCLVVQERRVSILDTTCSPNGLDTVANIVEAPRISQSGPSIVLRVTYNPELYDNTTTLSLAFTGEIQPDGTYVGIRRDVVPEDPESTRQVEAVLSRP